MASKEERAFLKAIKEDASDTTSRLAYADWLEEQGRKLDALEQRVKGGVSEAQYKLRRKSDGLFSEGKGDRWSAQGKSWRRLADIKAHLAACSWFKSYGRGTPWSDLEIVVFEVRPHPVANLAFSLRGGTLYRREVVIERPPEGKV
jgi:uncharacterized protein (TIGR02996 family)